MLRSTTPPLLAIVLTLWLGAPPLAAQHGPHANGLDQAGMDRKVKPGNNFFEYANGSWLRTTEIPADKSGTGAGSMLADLTDQRTAELIQDAAKGGAGQRADMRKVGDFYTSYMDTTAIEAAGLKPLQPLLDSIGSIRDRRELARALGRQLRADVDALNNTNFYTPNLFGLWVAQDLNDPTQYSPFLLQGGLGMPDRSYYTDSGAQMDSTRTAYRAHVARMLELARITGASAKADAIVGLETKMARAHWTREQSGDVSKGNNHWKRSEFASRAPGLDWDAFFSAARLDRAPVFTVYHASAVAGLSALVASEPLETWKAWLTEHAIQAHAGVLPSAFGQQSFAFYGTALNGVARQRDRWRRAVNLTNEALGFAIGKVYAERYFPAAEKARAKAMVSNLIAAFGDRIDHLEWMAPATKKQARAKLAVLKVGVGYPDRWPEYGGLEIKRGDAYGNDERAQLFALHERLAKLGQPVDRNEWVMTPQTVNAVNLPAMNSMNFPAAILSPPFFDPNRPSAMDYGAMGAVIGHEISHSFDNQGALFDAQGRLKNWWTPADFKHFEGSSKQLARQYSAYKPFPDLAINGQQTLGENIADLAGLAVSYDAYHRSLKGKPAEQAAGFSGDQQFFLSYAQAWRSKFRPSALRNRILTDGHAPGEWRAFTVRNLDPWYASFDVKPGETLYLSPAERVRIW